MDTSLWAARFRRRFETHEEAPRRLYMLLSHHDAPGSV